MGGVASRARQLSRGYSPEAMRRMQASGARRRAFDMRRATACVGGGSGLIVRREERKYAALMCAPSVTLQRRLKIVRQDFATTTAV